MLTGDPVRVEVSCSPFSGGASHTPAIDGVTALRSFYKRAICYIIAIFSGGSARSFRPARVVGSSFSRARARAHTIIFPKKSITSITRMAASPCPSCFQAVRESERK